jgi:hypothetical protein
MQAVRRTLAAALSAAAVLALAVPAGAATLMTNPCVYTLNSQSANGDGVLPIAATGFTPGSLVTIRYATEAGAAPVFLTSGTVDPAGNFTANAQAPSFNPFDRQLQSIGLVASDSVNPAAVAGTAYQQVRVGYTTNPASGKPTRQATHTVRGFPTGKNTYLHFRFQGKTKRNVKLGLTKGACGVVSKRMRLLPTTSRPGIWTVYADQKATYAKTTKPQLKYSFRITRTFG